MINMFETLYESLEDLYVPRVKSGFDEQVSRSDFAVYLQEKEPKFQEVVTLLDSNINDYDYSGATRKDKKKLLTSVIIVGGQHLSSNKWTTECTLEQSKIILEKVISICRYSSVAEALLDDNCFIFKSVLSKIRPWVLKDSWKNYPAAVYCYQWLIHHIQSPNLSDHLNIVLPTALIIIDDFETENKLIGLKCLEHIINNVGMAHLSCFDQDKVILKAIEPLFYLKDVKVIQPMTATLVILLKKKYPVRGSPILQMTDFDELIDKFLQNMILEQKLDLRSEYISALPSIIHARGLGMVIHSVNIFSIITEYSLEPTSSLQGLNVLQTYVDVCWPRIHIHCSNILVILCKICLGLRTKRFPSECSKLLSAIVKKLNNICPDEVNYFFNNLKNNEELACIVQNLTEECIA